MYILIGVKLLVFLLYSADPSGALISAIRFSPYLILHKGQFWRLVSYIFMPDDTNIVYLLLSLLFYYWAGASVEQAIGRLKFNFYYFATVLVLDAACLIAYAFSPLYAEIFSYSLSGCISYALVFAVATVNSSASVLFMFIIPLRLKYLAWIDLFLMIYTAVSNWQIIGAISLIPFAILLPYFLFFLDSWRELLPGSGRTYRRVKTNHRRTQKAEPNANWAGNYRSASGERPYHHKCTVCGRTDTDYPDLEFRYCSRCVGYRCYCMDHINDHVHITE